MPLDPNTPPIEARPVPELPAGSNWRYEPKWDGFRCLAFRDGDNIELRSKSGQPLARYFPDVAAAFLDLKAMRFALDGEIVIPVERRLSFEALQLRLHPAESRVRKLVAEHPAVYIAFDLLEDAKGRALLDKPFDERRRALEAFFAKQPANPALRLSPSTGDRDAALRWLDSLVGEIDGIIAKRADLPYLSGTRDAMQKYKRQKTADCVVGGFRYGKNSDLVGSLLLGLYDDAGLLHHVGFTATIPARDKPELTRRLEALIAPPGFTGRAPGGPSRWSTERSGEWQPLKPELVVEVRYDQVTDARFRHGTTLLRWRPDKAPQQCTFDQLPSAEGGAALALLGERSTSMSQPARAEGAE
ncbi:MAG TPA: ATP-dependent DNA ligase [Stellaceae bacterium]|jgi:ATP-dependent DNA ligase|nr:ATP-dependent DNA ligase [Stellaceae bacterium]